MNEFSSAGIEFKIGEKKIGGCFSTPDMGSEPEKIDTTSFDNEKYKSSIPGLMEPPSLNFDFYDQTENFTSVTASADTPGTAYSLTYPDGSGYSWTGSHRAFKLASAVGEPIKFRVACTAEGEINEINGTVNSGPTQTE